MQSDVSSFSLIASRFGDIVRKVFPTPKSFQYLCGSLFIYLFKFYFVSLHFNVFLVYCARGRSYLSVSRCLFTYSNKAYQSPSFSHRFEKLPLLYIEFPHAVGLLLDFCSVPLVHLSRHTPYCTSFIAESLARRFYIALLQGFLLSLLICPFK